MNPKQQWARKDNMTELLSLLKKHGELRFYELREKLGVSEPTLTEYIKTLEGKNKIEAFFKPEDRRQKWYRIKPENKEKVEAQLRQYEAISFIEGISNPIYSYQPDEKGKGAIAVLMSGIDPRVNGIAKKAADQYAKRYLRFLPRFSTQRIAVVIMVKGQAEQKEGKGSE